MFSHIHGERKSDDCFVLSMHGQNELAFFQDKLVAVTVAGSKFKLHPMPSRLATREVENTLHYRQADRCNEVLLESYAYKATNRARLFSEHLRKQQGL